MTLREKFEAEHPGVSSADDLAYSRWLEERIDGMEAELRRIKIHAAIEVLRHEGVLTIGE